MDGMPPPVAATLDFLADRLNLDPEWTVRDAGRLAWWAGPLAQRIWAAPAREEHGIEMTPLHIETDLLRDVPAGADTLERLAGINRLATLSAYVADPGGTRVRLHASVSLTADNWPLARMLAVHAAALQVADAHAEAGPLTEVFGGAPDASGHPLHGARPTLDEMLQVVGLYQERGEAAAPWSAKEFATLLQLDPRPWLMASSHAAGLEATLPFGPDPRVTSQLELDASYRHPALGSGLHVRLVVPRPAAAATVQRLNAAETEGPDAHQLGAWGVDEEARLRYAAFIPSAAYAPHLTPSFVYHMVARNDWAHLHLA
jgi:hypothetical protein